MFDRLMGMETEYALRFRPHRPDGRRPWNGTLFRRLVGHIRKKVPVVRAINFEAGWFLANGGNVRFDLNPLLVVLPTAGVAEGSTPECRGPRQLLRHQRAQDVLMSQAAAASGASDGEATLLKSNRDSEGFIHGCHENYEATIATGLALGCWRLGLVLLSPIVVLLIVAPITAIMFGLMLALLPYVLAIFVFNLFHRGRWPQQAWAVAVRWLIGLVFWPLKLMVVPFFNLFAFRHQRRQMTAFLMSRPVITGSGMVDEDGRFGLSPRATGIGSMCGVLPNRTRPVFFFGHVIKGMQSPLAGDPWSWLRLFRRRQRLQLAVGDSNMTQTAEFLKVGTTLLVLEAIEAGALEGAPQLRRPIKALRTICGDADLKATVRLKDGRCWTALEIQRFYLDACRRFVAQTAPGHAEAEEVLRLWETTLDALEGDQSVLVGRLDWVTKRYLLHELGPDAEVAAKHKLDLRYHELSRDGYYVKLEAAGVAPTLVDPEEVVKAIETPPEDTPATRRGQLIREHAGSSKAVRASWDKVLVGSRSGIVPLVAVVAGAFLGAGIVIALVTQIPDYPVARYEGRYLAEWTADLRQGDLDRREKAIVVLLELAKNGDRGTLPGDSGSHRVSALGALATHAKDDDRVVSAMLSAWNDSELAVRSYAFHALQGILPPAKLVPLLVDALNDNAASIRLNAAQSLIKMDSRNRSAIVALIAMAKEPGDWSVRLGAIHSLDEIDNAREDIESALRECLADKDKTIREHAQSALDRIAERAKTMEK